MVLNHCEKKIVLLIEKKVCKFEAEGQEFKKSFGITGRIYSPSDKVVFFFETEYFLSLLLEVLHPHNETIEWHFEEIIGI